MLLGIFLAPAFPAAAKPLASPLARSATGSQASSSELLHVLPAGLFSLEHIKAMLQKANAWVEAMIGIDLFTLIEKVLALGLAVAKLVVDLFLQVLSKLRTFLAA